MACLIVPPLALVSRILTELVSALGAFVVDSLTFVDGPCLHRAIVHYSIATLFAVLFYCGSFCLAFAVEIFLPFFSVLESDCRFSG